MLLETYIRTILLEEDSNKEYSEEEIYSSIEDHIVSNKNISEDILNYIIDSNKSENKLNDVLIKNNQIVFRGMKVNKSFINNLIGSDNFEKPGLYIIDKKTTFSPNNKESNTSSWSQNYEESERWMLGSFGNTSGEYGIVIVGVTKKENAFNLSRYAELINHKSRHQDEQEVVMIGNVEVIKIIISNKNNLQKEKSNIVPAKLVNYKKGFYPAASRKEIIKKYK